MAPSEHARRRARHAYELGRSGVGLRAAWPVMVILPLAVLVHGHVGVATLAVAATLALAATTFGWRGGAWLRGVGSGFAAGLPTLVVPAIVLAAAGGHGGPQCSGCSVDATARIVCIVSCLVSALVVGTLVGLRAARDPHPARFAGAAVAIAALTGLLGCSVTGLGGAAGVVGGLALGSIPAVLWAPRVRA